MIWSDAQASARPERLMHDVGAHAGEVVVAEAPIGLQEHAIAGLDVPLGKTLCVQ